MLAFNFPSFNPEIYIFPTLLYSLSMAWYASCIDLSSCIDEFLRFGFVILLTSSESTSLLRLLPFTLLERESGSGAVGCDSLDFSLPRSPPNSWSFWKNASFNLLGTCSSSSILSVVLKMKLNSLLFLLRVKLFLNDPSV